MRLRYGLLRAVGRSISAQDPLDRSKALFELADPLAQCADVFGVGELELSDHVGEPSRRLLAPAADLHLGGLTAANHLLAGSLPPAPDLVPGGRPRPSHLVQQFLGPLPRLGRGARGRGQGPLDRAAQGIADPFGTAFSCLSIRFGHRAELSAQDRSRSRCWIGSSIVRPVPVYLRPMAPVAPRAILCGDPARALMIAQEVLTEPRMSNHHRGLWGYHGLTPAGTQLTVHATGIGGPSACAIFSELIDQGVEAAVRIGSCRGGEGSPALGSTVSVTRILSEDGISAALGRQPGADLVPDQSLTAALTAGADSSLSLTSRDHFDQAGSSTGGSVGEAGGALVDLQSAGLATMADARGVRLAVGVVVAASPAGRLEDEPLEAASLRLARVAASALDALEVSGRG